MFSFFRVESIGHFVEQLQPGASPVHTSTAAHDVSPPKIHAEIFVIMTRIGPTTLPTELQVDIESSFKMN